MLGFLMLVALLILLWYFPWFCAVAALLVVLYVIADVVGTKMGKD